MKQKEWYFADKKDWGEGPWRKESDKVQWVDKDTGLPCLIVRNDRVTGALCGYVGVDEGHPWFGKSYMEIDQFGNISVHGGLTYGDFCQENNKEQGICHVSEDGVKRYWFGFDCAHSGDLSPRMESMTAKYRHLVPGLSRIKDWETYKDIAYVKEQCAELAKQIKAAVK